jgi:urea-proton symporter
MACTSGFSADIVSIAAVFTYDIYGAYINPTTSGGKLLRMSHLAVIVWSICMAIIATGISTTTIGVNYLVTCVGIFTSCAVFSIYSTTLWKRQNKIAIVVAPVLGSISAIASWLGSAYALYGSVTVATTNETLPLVIGNAVSLISGALYSIICTFVFGPDTFDWSRFQTELRVVDDSDIKGLTAEQLAQEKAHEHLTPEQDRALRRGKVQAIIIACVLCAIFVIIWPMPMYGTRYVFSKKFFRFWVALTFIWAFGAALVITILPLWDGKDTIALFVRRMVLRKAPEKDEPIEGIAIQEHDRPEMEDGGSGEGEKGAKAIGRAV